MDELYSDNQWQLIALNLASIVSQSKKAIAVTIILFDNLTIRVITDHTGKPHPMPYWSATITLSPEDEIKKKVRNLISKLYMMRRNSYTGEFSNDDMA